MTRALAAAASAALLNVTLASANTTIAARHNDLNFGTISNHRAAGRYPR